MAADLARSGLSKPTEAEGYLEELARTGIVPPLAMLPKVADPDAALLGLVRLAGQAERLKALDQDGWQRLMVVLGGSVALGEHLVRHPEHLAALDQPADLALHAQGGADSAAITPGQQAMRALLLQAVGADPAAARPVAEGPEVEPLRRAYRRQLLQVAAFDLSAPDPLQVLDLVGRALADLATGVLEAALALARVQVADHQLVDLTVIGLGKTGGRELNYVSDVDVLYVAEPASPEVDEARALLIGSQLAVALQKACSAPGREPVIWQVDPNLRPEGKAGPLVRTLASHKAYYQKWAETWEFQALLKARPVAGVAELGQCFMALIRPLVWEAAARPGFVTDAQTMRRRVEAELAPGKAEREIKLGAGGLRDVEFTVQLLQLVHGRTDPSLRSATTLLALEALTAGGYVGRDAAAALARCYRLERVLEHRLQLRRLRRTHLLPKGPGEQRWLARGAGLEPATAANLVDTWKATRRQVRALQQQLYYRPLLPQTASLSAGEARLAPDAARARLAGLGYRDPDGAMRHIAALTAGVTRRSAIQRQLLPVMLGWLAEGADPDAGLLAFRQLSDELGASPWFLRSLRDSAGAAQRLSTVLSASRYVSHSLAKSPEAAAWFSQDQDLLPRPLADLLGQLGSILKRQDSAETAAMAVRALRRRELTRVGVGIVLGLIEPDAAYQAISDAADLALAGALRIVQDLAEPAPPTRLAIIAMGSLGGGEMSLASDADVLFVHQPLEGADVAAAQAAAVSMAGQVRGLLGKVGPEPALEVDPDLRPEGRSGPVARTVAAYQEYYERWAQAWERQALLRARPVAGDPAVTSQFMAMAEQVRYREGGVDGDGLTELRLLKARIDSERLPRGVEPKRHLKLGPGGLLDVQWVAQLFQLQHAAQYPALRVTGTVAALQACATEGLIAADDVAKLVKSWRQAMAIRTANVLWSGRLGPAADLMPSEARQLEGVARLLGYPAGSGGQLPEDRARLARRARAVFERLFYS